MDKPGIDASECKKIFDSFGRLISGTRLASVPETVIQALQLLAKGAGEAGVTACIAEHRDARGLHPRLESVRYAGADLPAAGLRAGIDGTGLAVSFGSGTPAEEVIDLFFELDVERLPFEEAVRLTSAKELAAAPKGAARKSARPRH